MAITKTGKLWRGEDHDDLATYIREHKAGGYPVARVSEFVCPACQGTVFSVLVDDEEGCAAAICKGCRLQSAIADSAEHLHDADLGECACPCEGERFAVAVGLAMHADDQVRWISVGLRCLTDGTLGVYTDWKIDYAPTAHLLTDS